MEGFFTAAQQDRFAAGLMDDYRLQARLLSCKVIM